MTIEKVLQVVRKYRDEGYGALRPEPHPDLIRRDPVRSDKTAKHLSSMLDEMEQMCRAYAGEPGSAADQDRTEKVMRWLGFFQGVLWTLGLKTLFTLKAENRGGQDEE